MPYPGIPKSKEQKMERCVKEVMTQGKSKSSAIAICHDAIMGKTKKLEDGITININLNATDSGNSVHELTDKIADTIGEEVSKKKSTMKKKELKSKVDEKEIKKQDEPVEEAEEKEEEKAKAEEAEAKESEETKADEEKEEAKEEEAEEAEGEESSEESESEEGEDDEEEDSEEGEKADKSEDILKSILQRLDDLETLVKQAPAEGASDDKEETPEEGEADEEKAPEEEAKEESEEESEKIAKTEDSDKADTSSEGALLAELKKINDRLDKIEQQPAPSKVVVSREFAAKADGTPKDADARVAEINKRLDEILDIKDKDPKKYTESLIDEAFTLIEEKKQLEGNI